MKTGDLVKIEIPILMISGEGEIVADKDENQKFTVKLTRPCPALNQIVLETGEEILCYEKELEVIMNSETKKLQDCTKTLKSIAAMPGNLPDETYLEGFSNESKDRGIKIVAMREMAREQLKKMKIPLDF